MSDQTILLPVHFMLVKFKAEKTSKNKTARKKAKEKLVPQNS